MPDGSPLKQKPSAIAADRADPDLVRPRREIGEHRHGAKTTVINARRVLRRRAERHPAGPSGRHLAVRIEHRPAVLHYVVSVEHVTGR